MKKFKFLIPLVLLLVLVTPTAFARPGGGGGGGGSSSSGGGGGGSHYSNGSSYYSTPGYYRGPRYYRNPILNVINTIGFFGIATVIIFGKSIHTIYVINRQHSHCKKQLRSLSKIDKRWKLNTINNDVRDAFYSVSEAWSKLDQSIAINHCTEKLYSNHESKLQWMKLRNEINIIKSPKLLSNKVVLVKNNLGFEDSIVVYIRASMIDYTEKDGYVISGRTHTPTRYIEYWKFDYVNGSWILDEIIQPEDYKI